MYENIPSKSVSKCDARKALTYLLSCAKKTLVETSKRIETTAPWEVLFPNKEQPAIGAKAILFASHVRALRDMQIPQTVEAHLAVVAACDAIGVQTPVEIRRNLVALRRRAQIESGAKRSAHAKAQTATLLAGGGPIA